ncbi:MtrB/PioB family decaheme-associated outer membrane protein [Uliginosibacterium sediminicola]|uniref:MtrB/PioB family decaheme-associated outer membrane protein n=1 Tax=Uliginosibacterium sediminicola TaxID=2024550 RepID=A0ABU9YVU2_9RHOO
MNFRNDTIKLSHVFLAVSAALLSMQARAEDDNDEVFALKHPSNYVEIGAINSSRGSAKAGEYNGLDERGAHLKLNLDVRGGDAYSKNEEGGITRWSLSGTDLGLSSRAIAATLARQGSWNLGFGYDSLRHNISDSYQTPYQGSMGGSSFVLPSNFGLASNTNALSATQLSAMQTQKIYSTRENTSVAGGIELSPQLSFNADFNRLEQSGAKLIAVGAASKAGGATAQTISILPMPTDYRTDTTNLALSWKGEKGLLTSSYYGSYFRNNNDRLSFQTYAGATTMQNMATAPSNDLHQLNLDGHYALASKTKLTGSLSYGRNTQNASFYADPGMLNAALPTSSLDGRVITKNMALKLSNQDIKNLNLSLSAKLNERNNRTASNIYQFNAINANDVAAYPNTPLSVKKTQYELAGDYRISREQSARLAYTHEETHRWCGQYAVSATYPAGTNCVVATATSDSKIDGGYRIRAFDSLDLRIGYSYDHRRTDSDRYAKAAFSGNTSTLGAGVNGGDFYGFYPFFDASRTEQVLKTSLNWQASEALSLGLSGRYTGDRYDDSTYGVQNGDGWSISLDSSYAYSDKGTLSVYVSQQYRRRDLRVLNALPANAWSNVLQDKDNSLGLNLTQKGLLGGKLELAGDLNYSVGKTSYSTKVPYLATCSAAATLTCGSAPDISSQTVQLKFSGLYKLDKTSSLRAQYVLSRLSSNDYYYNAYQYGYTPNTVLPTNEQAPSYTQRIIELSYVHLF